MTKMLSYIGIAVGAIIVVLLFVTSKSYLQLGIAAVLYPVLTYLTLKLIPRYSEVYASPTINNNVGQSFTPPNVTANVVLPGKVDIVDIEKRTFLKLVGTAGLSFFIFSLLGRKAEDLIFNKPTPNVPTIGNDNKPVVTEEYKISEIDDGVVSYYGFINKDGNWYIMREDTPTNSFRYSKGESEFSKNWENRENLKYDYYDNLF